MPLDKQCQEIFSFMTDRAVFTPTRSIQGALNSATQFQARMAEIYATLLYKSLIIWIDDLLGYAEEEKTWFTILDRTLELADSYNLKFNIEKCHLFLKEVKFCGRIFGPTGVRHDPRRIAALTEMPIPTRANELQQILMASQWMARSIPNYNKIVISLQDILEDAMKLQLRRTKKAASRVDLQRFGWSEIHTKAFNELKHAITNAVKLAYPSDQMVQCVFCDASHYASSGVVTQIPPEDVNKPIQQQRHQPLGFVGHRFNGSELNWATIDKEAFAIKDTLKKLSYLLHMPTPFHLYTDHRNLLHMYNPLKCAKQSAERLIRWGIEIRDYNYLIHHISGENNHWADLLSRWGAGVCVLSENEPIIHVRALRTSEEIIPTEPNHLLNDTIRVQPCKNIVWPDTSEIMVEQSLHFPNSLFAKNSDGLLVDTQNRIVIPIQSVDLIRRMCIIAHAGCHCGHLSYKNALAMLQDWVYWVGMRQDIKDVCSACLHGLPTRKGFRIPRPL